MRTNLNMSLELNIQHTIPPRWNKIRVTENNYKDLFNELVSLLVVSNISINAIIKLRKTKFEPLYTNFHKELEGGTGVMFFKETDFKNIHFDLQKKIFLKVNQFFGWLAPINKTGDVIKEVMDTGIKDSMLSPVRGHMTNQELSFHSDRADITGLLCVSNALCGGEFKICSSANLYFSLLNNHIDILKMLSANIPHDLRNDNKINGNICHHPIFFINSTNFVVRYIRKFIESTERHGNFVSKQLLEALDIIDNIINVPSFYHKIDFKSGDIIFFNNHTTLHARNSFIDDITKPRCLLRSWLSSPFTRQLPNTFQPIFHVVEAGVLRGGIV